MATYRIDDFTKEDLDNQYTYHPPKPGQQARYEALRAKAKELATLIYEEVPFSEERSAALMFVDAAVFNANAAIARWDDPENELEADL